MQINSATLTSQNLNNTAPTVADRKETVAILGCGVLGRLIVQGLQTPDMRQAYEVRATQRTLDRAAELTRTLKVESYTNNGQACEGATIVVLAVRPQAMADLLKEISPSLKPGTHCVTIAAGLPLRFYEELLPPSVTIIRAHPSPMMAVRRGTIALSTGTRSGGPAGVEKTRRLFSTLCDNTLLIPERDLNMFATVFGSSSALLYRFIDAVLSAEGCQGEREFSQMGVLASMLEGAAQMLIHSGKSPLELSDEICTPHGMTAAGVAVWEREEVSKSITAAMEAVIARVAELSRNVQ
jgi:pyrroline-5-carboxylate reductase